MRLNKWLRAGRQSRAAASPPSPGCRWVAFESLDRPFRRRCPQSSPSPRKSQTATASCCAPMRRRTGAGGSPRRSTRSIRNLWRCWSPMRTSASTTIDGVDLLALARAATQFASNGRIVSGGSTLSMQLARLIEPRESRSFGQKLRQIFRAIQIERRLSKQRNPRTLPDAGALWRQSRRRARRLARLFRQGAEAADRLGSRLAGRTAAIARAPPPRPQPRRCASRARPRAGPHGHIRPARRDGSRPRRARRSSPASAAHCPRLPPMPPMRRCAIGLPNPATS